MRGQVIDMTPTSRLDSLMSGPDNAESLFCEWSCGSERVYWVRVDGRVRVPIPPRGDQPANEVNLFGYYLFQSTPPRGGERPVRRT